MAHSIFLMVTGGALIPKTQAPSQGAGQTLPVNSGKLLVYKSHFFTNLSQKNVKQY